VGTFLSAYFYADIFSMPVQFGVDVRILCRRRGARMTKDLLDDPEILRFPADQVPAGMAQGMTAHSLLFHPNIGEVVIDDPVQTDPGEPAPGSAPLVDRYKQRFLPFTVHLHFPAGDQVITYHGDGVFPRIDETVLPLAMHQDLRLGGISHMHQVANIHPRDLNPAQPLDGHQHQHGAVAHGNKWANTGTDLAGLGD